MINDTAISASLLMEIVASVYRFGCERRHRKFFELTIYGHPYASKSDKICCDASQVCGSVIHLTLKNKTNIPITDLLRQLERRKLPYTKTCGLIKNLALCFFVLAVLERFGEVFGFDGGFTS